MPNDVGEELRVEDCITPTSAGKKLGVHRNTVVRRAMKGAFRFMLVGETVFVSRTDVERAAKSAKAKARKQAAAA